jgi:hypothetical protein
LTRSTTAAFASHVQPISVFSSSHPLPLPSLQRRPHVYRRQNRQSPAACLPCCHHGRRPGHRRRLAILPSAAHQRVSSAASAPALELFIFSSHFQSQPLQYACKWFSCAHACFNATCTDMATHCARFHPPSAATASSSPGRSQRNAASAAACATKKSARTSCPPAPCPPSAPTLRPWSAQPLPRVLCGSSLMRCSGRRRCHRRYFFRRRRRQQRVERQPQSHFRPGCAHLPPVCGDQPPARIFNLLPQCSLMWRVQVSVAYPVASQSP